MNKNPYDTPEFRRVAELSRRVADSDDAQASHQAKIDDLNARRKALAARLAGVEANRPAIEHGIDPELVAALAADPTALSDPSKVAKRADDHVEASARWETDRAIVTHAIARLEADLEAARTEAVTITGPSGTAFRDFVLDAHETLLTAFLDGFRDLKVNFLEPMRLLAALNSGGQIVGGGVNQSLIVGYGSRRLGTGSKIETEQWLAGGSGTSTTQHLHAGPVTPEERRTWEDRLAQFRAALADVEAAAPAQSPRRGNKAA